MLYQVAAELVLVAHLGFVLFVVFGGLAVRWLPWMAWVHLPCFVWGAVVNLASWVCPLTPLENHFRQLAGQTGYQGGFLEQYITPIVYPSGMTREVELLAGFSLPAWNLAVYAWVWWALRREQAAEPSTS